MDLFPPFDPYATGMLDVGNGHSLYWEQSGNPAGMPVVFLHGGPGAGTAPAYRRFFDPALWRVVLFDQRGCGRSRPEATVAANTTADLIADIERLRRHLGIERWMLFGGSWGSTLALAYGQAWPARVSGFVLRGIFLFERDEVAWFLGGMGRFFPEAWARFAARVAPETDLLAAYHRRLGDPNPAVHLAAAQAWCAYEEACARLIPRVEMAPMDQQAALAMARLECHYMVHGGFLPEGALLAGMGAIAHLPCTIVQGRYDMVCPPSTAVRLADAWPRARLAIVAEGGHSAMETGIRIALVMAVDSMRSQLN
ncbi:MAG: prolyl aminopeptidase [Magnetospirillum sp.]|nr:prolyl aminopeptidase [Magnetospirillum sp.]